ncbi:hypothetical protein T492DRAFT_889399 [Pavlovales sp. CCMP2436]|nr:hypothetical protein T492DRAFT_889399 [Pavlovales sp. CCMP2436]
MRTPVLLVLLFGAVPRPLSGAQFLVFELDHGSLSNVMGGVLYAAEMACATGRTLVLPPPGSI